MFGSEYFSVSDRSRWYGEGFGLTYDWLQYWPALLSKQGVRYAANRIAQSISAGLAPSAQPSLLQTFFGYRFSKLWMLVFYVYVIIVTGGRCPCRDRREESNAEQRIFVIRERAGKTFRANFGSTLRRQGHDPQSIPRLVLCATDSLSIAAALHVQRPASPCHRLGLDQQLQLGPL